MNRDLFIKSHGLGNDYIILVETNISFSLNEKSISKICDYHYGVGSDGILLHVSSNNAEFGLRIFNPDGSEAEKSGNGLRIFCKYVYDEGLTSSRNFTVETPGGIVHAHVVEEHYGKARVVSIDMGKAIFNSSLIPVKNNNIECLREKLLLDDKTFEINCVSVGNPHCIILTDELDEAEIMEYGTIIENHVMFPNRINVQFVKVIDRKNAAILIWERGAGYTLASGSSSCAVASMLKKLGLVDNDVSIKMPGGELCILLDDDYNIRMTGEVREIARGHLSKELTEEFIH